MKIIKNIFFTVVTWGIILFALNYLCGFVAKNQYIALDPLDQKMAEKTYGYFYPNQDKLLLFPGMPPYRVRVDSNGFRSVGVDSKNFLGAPGITKILCLGDSITFGLFVNDEDSYPYRLQSLIEKNGKQAIALNAGVGGATLPDYLYYLRHKGLILHPDVVILNFCYNDVQDIGSKKAPVYQQMIDENKFSLSRKLKLMKMMRMFRHFEVAYRYHRWMQKTDDPRRREIYERDSKDLEDILYVAGEYFGPMVKNQFDEKLKEKWSQFFVLLGETIDLLSKENIRFLYVLYPDIYTLFDRGNGYYQDTLIEFLKARGVDYIDLRTVFKPRRDEFLSLYNHLPRDFHLSGKGNQIFAEEVYKRIFGAKQEAF
jgi:lysophospholipase L1-like esterase